MDKPILNNPRKILFFLILTLVFLIPFFIIQANGSNCDTSLGRICNPLNENMSNIPVLIKTALEGFVKICIPLIVLAIIYCGFLFISAQGETEKITKARNALLYTIIGAAVLLGAWGLAQIISSTVLDLKKPSETTPTETFEPSPTPTDEPIELGCPNPDYINRNEDTTGFLRNLFKVNKILAQINNGYLDVESFTLIDENDPNKKKYYFNTLLTSDSFANMINLQNYYQWNFEDKTLINRLGINNPNNFPVTICLPSWLPKKHYSGTYFQFNKTKYPEFSFSPETPIKDTNDTQFINRYLKTTQDYRTQYSTLNTIENIEEGLGTRMLKLNTFRIGYDQERGRYKIYINAKNFDQVLNTWDSRHYEYVNSDMFVERQAASYYWKIIDINKFTTDSSYREGLVEKWLQDNPDAKTLIAFFRNKKYGNITYTLNQITSHLHFAQGNSITVNPLMSINGYTKEEELNLLAKQTKSYEQSSLWNSEPQRILEAIKELLDYEETQKILSHEYIHAIGRKSELINKGLSINNIYPENEFLWNINKQCTLTPYDENCKSLLGYSREKIFKNLDGSQTLIKITHDQAPEELKSDIGSVRDYLFAKHNFDHQKQFFTIQEFNKLMNDENFTQKLTGKRLIEEILGNDPDVWIKVMNIIAKNKTQDNLA